MILYCATTNQGKLKEFRSAAGQLGHASITIDPLPGLREIEAPEETGATFEENATIKAVYYSRHASGLAFCDDSGIEITALGGAPGVYSARFAGPNANDEDNNRLLLEKLAGTPDRSARYVCVVAVAREGRLLGAFRGVVNGTILEAGRGTNGFGYDPLFFYPPFDATFGETAPERKLLVSHRGLALKEMLDWVSRQG